HRVYRFYSDLGRAVRGAPYRRHSLGGDVVDGPGQRYRPGHYGLAVRCRRHGGNSGHYFRRLGLRRMAVADGRDPALEGIAGRTRQGL
ncbi:uncharacterized protein METZ01_LOCUS469872, partial [marine metagenome]